MNCRLSSAYFVLFVLSAAASLCAVPGCASKLAGAGQTARKERTMLQGVVHINYDDSERQGHGLKNISNILQDVEGNAQIEVICHGAGITLVTAKESEHAKKIAELQEKGVRFFGCENTLREKSIPRDELLPDVETVPSGAVAVIRRQQDGYGYFRP